MDDETRDRVTRLRVLRLRMAQFREEAAAFRADLRRDSLSNSDAFGANSTMLCGATPLTSPRC